MKHRPLGRKCYGSIPHLPESRLGAGDHYCHPSQAAIAYGKLRDEHDNVIVLEKLDGTNVGVAKIDGSIIPLNRSGYIASTSPYRQHQLFAEWVYYHQARFDRLLDEGERICGEWLLQAHGSRYDCPHEPFVVFDMFDCNHVRYTWRSIIDKLKKDFVLANVISWKPLDHTNLDYILKNLEPSGHGCLDPVEGAVWRVEREGKVDFLCKYVRHDKVDGAYLDKGVWNNFVGDEWLKARLSN